VSARVERLLSEPDREEIRRVVAETERETSAEIVVCVVGQSDDYSDACWRAGLVFGVIGGLIAFLWGTVRLRVDEAFYGMGPLDLLLAVSVAGSFGAALTGLVPTLRRGFVSSALRDHRVQLRAERAFLTEEVFATEGRTGILLFVSLFERVVCVLADRGVREAVAPEAWSDISDRIARGIREGKLRESLCRGVSECGAVLSQHGLERGDTDRNELDDRVRLE